MIHDETACIGCTACMDACREVNQVPEGVSRLEIIRSGPIGTFLMPSTTSFASPASTATTHPACTSARPVPPISAKEGCRRQPGSLRRLHVLSGRLPLSGALYQPCDQGCRQVRLLPQDQPLRRARSRRAWNPAPPRRWCSAIWMTGQSHRQTAGEGDHLSLPAGSRHLSQDVPRAQRGDKVMTMQEAFHFPPSCGDLSDRHLPQ